MDQQAMNAFVDRVLADADRAFGATADGALLDRYARVASLDLWAHATPGVTVSVAQAALRELRHARAQRSVGMRSLNHRSHRDREISS